MQLDELIETLEALPADMIFANGFSNPQSYRGFYDCLAFEPIADVSVSEMLSAAREAMGATYSGYKGGEYVMGEYTDCYIARYSETGEALTPTFFRVGELEAENAELKIRLETAKSKEV